MHALTLSRGQVDAHDIQRQSIKLKRKPAVSGLGWSF